MTEPTGINVYPPKIRDQSVSRKFVSQYGPGYLALGVFDFSTQQPVDPDVGSVTLKVWYNSTIQEFPPTDPRGIQIISVDDHTPGDIILRELDAAGNPEPGKFYYNIGPQHTQERGVLVAEWNYDVGGSPNIFMDYLQILDQMPVYDRMSEENKVLIEQCSWFFADLFDSTTGGPWLQENFQTHFGFERMAQLLGQAVMKFNVIGYPITNYGITPDAAPVPANFSAILLWGFKLEVIRHLMRSYTEQPNYPNATITWTDRRDYVKRWQDILDEEKDDYLRAVKMSKRGLLNLARGALLVAGGIFGGGARGIFINGMGFYASMARSARFYPASFAIMGTGNNLSR
jgi:hypothetical protein